MKYFLSTVVLLIYWLTAVTLSQSPTSKYHPTLPLQTALGPYYSHTDSTEGCADGQVYNSCGSKCLLTCDNYQEPPVACEQVCVEGCFCAEGLLEHNGSCVSPQECPVQTGGFTYVVVSFGIFSTCPEVAYQHPDTQLGWYPLIWYHSLW